MKMLKSVYAELLAVAAEGQRCSEEVGGFVLISVPVEIAQSFHPLRNAAPALRDRCFVVDPGEAAKTIEIESPRGKLASFHTHPSDPAVVSSGDLDVFRSTGSKIAFIHGSDGLKCFRLQVDDSFIEEEIEVAHAAPHDETGQYLPSYWQH